MGRKEGKDGKSGMGGQTQSSHIFKFAGPGNKWVLCCPPWRGPKKRGQEARPLGHVQAEHRVTAKNAGQHRRWVQGTGLRMQEGWDALPGKL